MRANVPAGRQHEPARPALTAFVVFILLVLQACSGDGAADDRGQSTTETTVASSTTSTSTEASSADVGPPLGWAGATEVPAGTCSVEVATNEPITEAVDNAEAGDVVCVLASDRPTEVVTVATAGVELLADGEVIVAGVDIAAAEVRIEGFEITNDEVDVDVVGIYIAAENVEVVGNYVHDTKAEGIACSDDLGDLCNGVTIRENTLLRNVGVQMETWGSDVTVEGNDIRQPVWTEDGRDTDSLRVMGGSNQVVRGNYFEIPNINEITPDPHPDCIMMFDSSNPDYADWVVNEGVVIENNICVNDSEHNCFILSGRQQQRSGDFIIRNNVCDHAGTNAFFIEDLDGVLLSNNLCTERVARNCIALVGEVTGVTSQNNVFAGDGVLHQVNIPDDTMLIEFNNYQGDLTFEDPTSDDPRARYRPDADPALVDAGTDEGLAPDDIVGEARVQGSAPDIGPYESRP